MLPSALIINPGILFTGIINNKIKHVLRLFYRSKSFGKSTQRSFALGEDLIVSGSIHRDFNTAHFFPSLSISDGTISETVPVHPDWLTRHCELGSRHINNQPRGDSACVTS
jgi:hypothetical protein